MTAMIEDGQIIEANSRIEERDLVVVRFATAAQVPNRYVRQLVAKSLQQHIREFEGPEDVGWDDPQTGEHHTGRFESEDAFYEWAQGKERIFYLMLNQSIELPEFDEANDIGGVIWFGRRANEHIPEEYGEIPNTFAVRMYDEDRERGWQGYVGTGLAKPFMRATHDDVGPRLDGDVWLEYVTNNVPAGKAYEGFGYRAIKGGIPDEHNPTDQTRERTLMVYEFDRPDAS